MAAESMSLRDMLFWFFITLFGTGTYVIYGSQSATGEIAGIAMIVIGLIGMVSCAWPHLKDAITGSPDLAQQWLRRIHFRSVAVLAITATVILTGFRIYRHYYPLPPKQTSTDTSGHVQPLTPLESLTVSPIRLVFKDQSIGKISNSQIVTVINRANAPRFINGIKTTGNFSQTNDCPSELMIGDSCNIEVEFTPMTLGLVHGDLEISSYDSLFPSNSLLTQVNFSGSGKSARLEEQAPKKQSTKAKHEEPNPQQSSPTIPPAVVGVPQNPTPVPTIYQRVKQTSEAIDQYKQQYVNGIGTRRDEAKLRAQSRARNISSTEQDKVQAEKDQVKKDEDEEIRNVYMSFNDSANEWINQQRGSLVALHKEAISRMANAKPDAWTPRVLENDSEAFNAAINAAGSGLSFSDLRDGNINLKRFDALSAYFRQLTKQLSDFPDN